ncbi:MAG: hypothetical protein ACXADY_09990 [Candidatus Hodarchaeales archaeon]|jgi:hypothetical protein
MTTSIIIQPKNSLLSSRPFSCFRNSFLSFFNGIEPICCSPLPFWQVVTPKYLSLIKFLQESHFFSNIKFFTPLSLFHLFTDSYPRERVSLPVFFSMLKHLTDRRIIIKTELQDIVLNKDPSSPLTGCDLKSFFSPSELSLLLTVAEITSLSDSIITDKRIITRIISFLHPSVWVFLYELDLILGADLMYPMFKKFPIGFRPPLYNILDLLAFNGSMGVKQLSEFLNKTTRSIRSYLDELKAFSLIVRMDPTKRSKFSTISLNHANYFINLGGL